jgi:RNA polymerase sigma-70 factor (ECF subfamily)
MMQSGDRLQRGRTTMGYGATGSISDEALLQAWRAGDGEAGNALFERHYSAMVRFFHNKVDREAEDLIQRVFLACVEGRNRFEGRSSFRTYLFAIANNVLRQHVRTKLRRGEPDVLDSAALCELEPTASTMLARTWEQGALLVALRRVPASVQVLMELHYWERLTSGEVAEVLGVPVATAKTRLRRGRLCVAKAMQEVLGRTESSATTVDDLERWAAELRGLNR